MFSLTIVFVYGSVGFAGPENFSAPRVSPDEYDSLLEQAVGLSAEDATSVHLFTKDENGLFLPFEDLLSPIIPPPEKEASIGVDIEGSTEGFLSGKAVYLSQCHGWIYSEYLGRFATQRGNNFETVEDFHNPEGTNQYLIHYLENAGARVYTTKERGMNTNFAIADNDGSGYSESGSDFEDGPLGFMDKGQWLYGEDPFNEGTTRKFPSNGGSTATWIPEVPESGFYTIYVSWDTDSQNSSQAHYRITHNGGSVDRYFDQTVHGSTWQYVEQLWLEEGVGSVKVELLADETQSGRYLSADAVRIGGGMGDVVRSGDTSERPRWEEGAIQYAQFNGAPTSVYDPYNDGDGSDPAVRSRWAAWEHPTGEDAVYLSWHSNASDGNARGTSTYIYSPDWGANTGFVTGSDTFASYVQDEMIDIFRSNWESSWSDRGVRSANFAEVNPNHNNEMPSILIELAFHDNETDTGYLKEPLFRRDASKAMYRGIVQYFANKDGTVPQFTPNIPSGLRTRHDAGKIIVSWDAPSTVYGDAADHYLLFFSDDGLSWSEGEVVQGTSSERTVTSYRTQYVRVAAVNDGGASFPSNTLAFSRSPDDQPPILIIDAFDRLQSSTLYAEEVPTLGTVKRMNLRMINSYQSAVPHASAVDTLGWGFDSASDEVLSNIDLSAYDIVIWIAGEESTVDESISSSAQVQLEDFWRSGGKLFVSGAEILWDLDYRGDTQDQAFVQDVLGATMESDDAQTGEAEGEDILSGLSLDFSFDDGAAYHVEYPDVLNTTRAPLVRYSTGGIAATLGEGVFFLGFPFECIGDERTRESVMKLVLEALLDDYSPPVATEPTSEPTEEPTTEPSGQPSGEPSSDSDLYTFDKEPIGGAKGCAYTRSSPLWEFVLFALILNGRRKYVHRRKD